MGIGDGAGDGTGLTFGVGLGAGVADEVDVLVVVLSTKGVVVDAVVVNTLLVKPALNAALERSPLSVMVLITIQLPE